MLTNVLALSQRTLSVRGLASILHKQQQQQQQPPSVMASASAQGPVESDYKPLVTMLLPALLHMRAQGVTAEAMDTATGVWFEDLKRSLTSCLGMLVLASMSHKLCHCAKPDWVDSQHHTRDAGRFPA
jgi:hypothetical protein